VIESSPSTSPEDAKPPDGDRRDFLTKVTVGASAVCIAFPFATGVTTFIDPLLDIKDADEGPPWTRVTALATLAETGTPVKCGIVLEQVRDAWTTLTDVPVGAVYLLREGEVVKAFNVKCPHLGCAIDYRSGVGDFFCPCHNSSFDLEGSVSDSASPSPRGMDLLETKVEDDQVWVRFQHFRPNVAEKVPLG